MPRRLMPVLVGAAAYAVAELLAGVFIGRFFEWGRAEALLFLALRPWLLLVTAALVRRMDWSLRLPLYVLALLLAATSETLFLAALGAEDPWPEALRGAAAGAAMLLVFDLVLQAGRRLGGRAGTSIATGLLALLLIAGGMRAYEAVAVGGRAAATAEKRDLMLVSALPLVWGEKGPLDASSGPAASYGALAAEFRIRPLDVLDEKSLGTGRLLLIAQPRALAPEELVALDAWVRSGGRALILTDPDLRWPSELPIGDIRRAPSIGLLDPLLTHWGLRLDSPSSAVPVTEHVRTGGEERRLVMFAPGRFHSVSDDCRLGPMPQLVRCRLGLGRVTVLADADMLHDRWWVGPGRGGAERLGRSSDNVLIVADWLDALAGAPRTRAAGRVEWLDASADRSRAWTLALLPILAAATLGLGLRLARRG